MKVREPDMGKIALFARFFNHVPEEGDLLIILLKGHLMVESSFTPQLPKSLRIQIF